MQKVKALANFDGHQKGDEIELPPEYAKAVVVKGLAQAVKEHAEKAAPAPENKMAGNHANKSGRGRRLQGNEK